MAALIEFEIAFDFSASLDLNTPGKEWAQVCPVDPQRGKQPLVGCCFV